jgi:hypothetical protein
VWTARTTGQSERDDVRHTGGVQRRVCVLVLALLAAAFSTGCDPAPFFSGEVASVTPPNRMCLNIRNSEICGTVKTQSDWMRLRVGDCATARWSPKSAGGEEGRFWDFQPCH